MYFSCFIGETGVFFGAFLGPIFVILLFNLVIFVTVVIVIIKHRRKSLGRKAEKNKYKGTIRLFVGIVGLSVLFGLGWLFGAFTISEASTTFQVLFVVSNAFQGFYFFLFFCVLSKEVRDAWLEVLRHPISRSSHTEPRVRRPTYSGSGAVSQPRAQERRESQPTTSTSLSTLERSSRPRTSSNSTDTHDVIVANPRVKLETLDEDAFESPAEVHPKNEKPTPTFLPASYESSAHDVKQVELYFDDDRDESDGESGVVANSNADFD